MGNLFENTKSWLSYKWIVKECKSITDCDDTITIDTILAMDSESGMLGLIAFYENGWKYPQYVTIPFSTKANVTAGTLVPVGNTKVMTLEKDDQLEYRLIC